MKKIAFDVIGPFKYPDGRKLYELTIQDEFTKFIYFCGIRNCWVEDWILYYGMPKHLLSDNDSNLCGEIMVGISSYFYINRITEFIRGTDKELEETTDWNDRLKLASYCYNTTVHATTGYNPYYLMFERQARPNTSYGRPDESIPDSYLERFNINLKELWARAKQNIIKCMELAVAREKNKVVRRKFWGFLSR